VFLKWGTGKNEVKLIKNKEEYIFHSIDQGRKTWTYNWAARFWIDGKDNIYLGDDLNKRVLIISADGNSFKTVEYEKTGGISTVDANGNIYGSHQKKGGPPEFTVTKPDGTQQTYKNFRMWYEENGIAFDHNNNSITITDNGNMPEKLPPHLYHISRENDIDFEGAGSFTIHTEKIKNHLKKINRKLDVDEINVNLVERGDLGLAEFIGIDDNAYSYFYCAYFDNQIYEPWSEVDAVIYSPLGQKIGEIPFLLNDFYKELDIHDIQLDIQGNVFQTWASEDGLHILKWQRN
jgi:hypothetical protein